MRFSHFIAAFSLFSLAAALPASVTDTDTPTQTLTFTDSATPTVTLTCTVTPTPTPGAGTWAISTSSPLIYGSSGNSATWSYSVPGPWANGQLVFVFPTGVTLPDSTNFYVQPSQAGNLGPSPYTFNGVTVTVNVALLPASGTLNFLYGYNPGGFSVLTDTALTGFGLYTAPDSVSIPAPVTPVAGQPVIPIVTMTVTPTATPTPTITITFTPSPTITTTFSITQTYTETPVATAPADGLLCYPNPFDLRQTDKVTIRFQPVTSISVQVFNLMGEPVRTLDPGDLYPANGWAIWHGEDDYLRPVGGGIYFVRVKTPDKVMIKRFTVLR
jgi:hypothetical protein